MTQINDNLREKLVELLAEILEVPAEDVGNHVLVVLTRTEKRCSPGCAGFHHLAVLSSIREASPTIHLLEKAADTLIPAATDEALTAIENGSVIVDIQPWLDGGWPGEGPGA